MDALTAFGALLTPEGRNDPFPYYSALHEHGPVTDLGEGAVVVGYEALAKALRNPSLAEQGKEWMKQKRPGWVGNPAAELLTDAMPLTGSPDHERVRRLMSKAFTPRRVTALTPAVERLTDDLLDHLADMGAGGAPVDFMAEFAYTLPVTVVGELIGVPEQDRLQFRPLVEAMSAPIEPAVTEAQMEAAGPAALELLGYFADLVATRRAEPRDDLVSALIQVHDEDDSRLSDRELLCNLIFLLGAGFDTVTSMLGNGMALLLDRPEHLSALRAHPATAPRFVEEFLRFDSPMQLTSRWAPEGVEVEGVTIPPGGEAMLLIGAANRDPRRFEQPDVFDPTRPANQPHSFGGGPHFCMGAALARLEGHIAFARLLRRFPDIAGAGERTRSERLTVRCWETLPVTVE